MAELILKSRRASFNISVIWENILENLRRENGLSEEKIQSSQCRSYLKWKPMKWRKLYHILLRENQMARGKQAAQHGSSAPSAEEEGCCSRRRAHPGYEENTNLSALPVSFFELYLKTSRRPEENGSVNYTKKWLLACEERNTVLQPHLLRLT